MLIKQKKFCTRPWGFGSNIVNYLKSAMYCHQNGFELMLQDRYNSIGSDFSLFSVVDLPGFIHRTEITKTIPVDNLKSLLKFNLNSNFTFLDKLIYSFSYLMGLKSNFFLKNFNSDVEINSFFSKNFQKNADFLPSIFWTYTLETKKIFQEFDEKFNFADFTPDLSLQIRGGDKIGEILTQGCKVSTVDEYIQLCLNELTKKGEKSPKVFIMTDTYSYFQVIRSSILDAFPKADVRSFVTPEQEGYSQTYFNNLDYKLKVNSYYFFLYELEMLRKPSLVIGSFNSNIFYLAYLIRYKSINKFISLDTTFEKSFL